MKLFISQGADIKVRGVADNTILHWAVHSMGGPDEVRDIIKDTATDLGPRGWDVAYGWGLINAAAALGAAVPESVPRTNRR